MGVIIVGFRPRDFINAGAVLNMKSGLIDSSIFMARLFTSISIACELVFLIPSKLFLERSLRFV